MSDDSAMRKNNADGTSILEGTIFHLQDVMSDQQPTLTWRYSDYDLVKPSTSITLKIGRDPSFLVPTHGMEVRPLM